MRHSLMSQDDPAPSGPASGLDDVSPVAALAALAALATSAMSMRLEGAWAAMSARRQLPGRTLRRAQRRVLPLLLVGALGGGQGRRRTLERKSGGTSA